MGLMISGETGKKQKGSKSYLRRKLKSLKVMTIKKTILRVANLD